MKDIEKIKSEDLGCQVADANPGNFGIEQEVAAMVGATVPAPTEPSADDARELGAQLLVFLRRALLPIRSALRTALAAIYAHLDSRCTDYTPAAYAPYIPRPYDPMRPFVPRTLPNILTAITAFAPRKISDLGDCPDGISFARLLCDSTAPITEIKDDNTGWVMDRTISGYPNLTKATIGCKSAASGVAIIPNNSPIEEASFPALETMYFNPFYITNIKTLSLPKLKSINAWYTSGAQIFCNGSYLKDLEMPSLESIEVGNYLAKFCYNNANLETLIMPKCKVVNCNWDGASINSNPKLARVQLGTLTTFNTSSTQQVFGSCAALIDLEIGAGTAISLNFAYWNPTDKGTTFLQNFKEHIALRLTDQGSGKTLTLSQAVFDTIWNQDGTPKSTDPDSVIYQINKIIKTDKHWSVNRA